MNKRTITLNNMNSNIIKMQYAVPGVIYTRATEIQKELQEGIKKPFKELIKANSEDCHAMGQKPVTYIRQVLSLCIYPDLMEDDEFPSDVKKRTSEILNSCAGHSIGSYCDCTGVDIIKEHVAQYIERRDGIPSDSSKIFLCTGASDGIKSVLNLFSCDNGLKQSGVMVPIPQYPLYSAYIAEYGLHPIEYYLDEDNAWALSLKELRHAIEEARKVCHPRVLVVINPGNPTGSVLTKENMQMIIKFAYEEDLFIMADEVYQDSVYAEGMSFYSFKKVMMEMGEPYKSMELASFMSASKGFSGECGLRGGYCEMVNVDPEVLNILLKSVATRLCSNKLGQAAIDCVINPPQPGEPSYNLFMKEKTDILHSLKEKAELVTKTFNSMKNIKCNKVTAAMYAFPQLILPQKAVEKAKSLGQSPDFFYAMQLLENTGICVVPGSEFGQVPGTHHFRATILPQSERLKEMLSLLERYHNEFLEEYE